MKTTILILGFLILASCGQESNQSNSSLPHPQKFIKAVHYFADAWPKTFWQEFEYGKVDADFTQIKNDGFNTVILVVPWKGFEMGFANSSTTSDAKMYQRLDFLLNKITQHNLDFMLRLGFPHDYSPNSGTDVYSLCTAMYENQDYQSKWLDYLNNIKKITLKYSKNQAGILVSWEDFWCPHFVFPLLDEDRRKELAQNIGFSEWLLKKDETTLKVILAKNAIVAKDIAVPKKDEMAYFYYIEFIDEKFNQSILNPAKSVFPDTGMEIRIDKDPATSSDGSKVWIAHDLHLDSKNHRGTYWAPFWGADNNYETLTLKQALFNFEYFLNYITDNGKATNQIIEQFNFVDNTPYFPNHAKLNPQDVDKFLLQTTALLKKYSRGYGLWAYRDYADNALYNASFEFGLDGWEIEKARLVGDNNDHQVHLQAGGKISQSFQAGARLLLAKKYSHMTFCLNAQNAGTIRLLVNAKKEAEFSLKTGENCYQIAAAGFQQEQTQFALQAQTNITLDELKIYGFVQKLDVYDEFNNASKYC